MEINAGLAAELAILTEALDDPGSDVAESLLHLSADARTAVASYLGVMVVIARTDPPIAFTAFEEGVEDGAIRSSLMLVPARVGHDGCVSRVSLILFAGAAGAFVDLAADLSWMTGRRLADVILDQHLSVLVGRPAAGTLRAASAVNQAVGILVGRGYTPEQANRELDARAADADTDRHRAAALVLTTIPIADLDPNLDILGQPGAAPASAPT